MRAQIKAVSYYLPEQTVSNEQLAAEFRNWSAERISKKTGIDQRHIAADHQCASDMAVKAAEDLFQSGACGPEDIDYLLLCTQSPDYFIPTTACLVQDRLGISRESGGLDFNLGCSGYVYGLGLAQGLIETGQAENVLLITSETYSKHIHPQDKSVRTLFGDAAAATLVSGKQVPGEPKHYGQGEPLIGPFVYGTDGSGAENLIVPVGGMRTRRLPDDAQPVCDSQGNIRTLADLFMNGPEVLRFTLQVVPGAVRQVLEKANLALDDVDLFVFHQANLYILNHLRKKIHIPTAKFFLAMRDCGNTVSCTIPIALRRASDEGRLTAGQKVLIVGFGAGYSWAAAMIRWPEAARTAAPGIAAAGSSSGKKKKS